MYLYILTHTSVYASPLNSINLLYKNRETSFTAILTIPELCDDQSRSVGCDNVTDAQGLKGNSED